jgi:hypothetical protein
MAFSASGAFRQYFIDGHSAVFAPNLDLETHKVALYNNSVTLAAGTDYDASAANSAYGAGTFASNEISGTGYTAGGTALTSTTVTGVAGGILKWTATNTAWTTATFSNVYGCLIYHDALTTPVADQGICAVAFGGAFQVTAGTFTIQWNASGILQIDYA